MEEQQRIQSGARLEVQQVSQASIFMMKKAQILVPDNFIKRILFARHLRVAKQLAETDADGRGLI